MPWRKLKITPRLARNYLFFALVFMVMPSLLSFYFPSHKGRLLVAAGATDDAYFSKTVLYMTMHNAFGASGFIMNKPLDAEEAEDAKARFPMMERFYYGGPVRQPYTYYWLVPLKDMPDGFELISPEQLQDELPDQYNAIVSNPDIAKTVWVMKGYAGWGLMQLNREIFRGAWNTIDYDPALIFDTPAGDIWPKATAEVLRLKKLSDERI